MSDSAGGSVGRTARGALPKVLSAAVFAAAGLLFWASYDTAHGTNIRSDESLLRTSDLIRAKSHKNAQLEEELADLRTRADALAHAESGEGSGPRRRDDALAEAAGVRPVTGDALAVTLNDAPPGATARVPGVPQPQPNDLVIHQQDLQAVVNALWRGGARAVQVMDQRLISTSAVRCVGNTLILQGRVYSPPYTITAVGDPDALRHAVDQDPSITNYKQYVTAYGLGWKVDPLHHVTLPGYSGTVDLHYAQPLG
ncbi:MULTISPECIES: DUF881 domain-containing protein [Streptomycetaceae]|uniref:DUF881 domain-containing protein n=1 Tax=Streptantibioticus cattleyicolor (strain ATCC 35852 / DSM 46488 / JCM 4925 / NBRC 14057 / NRRL 8057) TaxID=1003195 RepID=F8K2T0_STREN|nr:MULTISPECIES: DUF881 domain-containing protein [Streptomycetaceae]AEW95458.1 hypothetical protein SCATT_30870 [Streptantibioticus cattleyicolor NRRL 8057 = DSM 46488]MYS60024.1 DUF881 domain-containing protein [Streptomyces sp. SID5468]CCB75799.1 conserved protein of unknown function [Streptantibioticus cattleyicolor NRRL 8057 = DSM 46488]